MHSPNSSSVSPLASRPEMPEYWLLPADQGRGLLPWEWAKQHLENSRNYWIATTRPDNRPHMVAVWGVWWEDVFYFSTAPHARKTRNLAQNSNCVVSIENAAQAVIVEGHAQLVSEPETLKQIGQVYLEKYGSAFPGNSSIFAVRPKVVFGFIEDGAEFSGSATRWHFLTEQPNGG